MKNLGKIVDNTTIMEYSYAMTFGHSALISLLLGVVAIVVTITQVRKRTPVV